MTEQTEVVPFGGAFAAIPNVTEIEVYNHVGGAPGLRVSYANGYILSVIPEYDWGLVPVDGECEIALFDGKGFATDVPGFEDTVQRHLSLPEAAAEAVRCANLPPR